jgi:hemin uptake protein HemP
MIIIAEPSMRTSTMFEPTPTLSTSGADLAATTTPRFATPRVDSLRLLGGGRELVIQHGNEEYRLRLTRNDKLILTK